jgi:hypothetical protein
VVRDGLKPGERVIVQGMQKVSPGMHVNPKQSGQMVRSGE